MRSDIVGLIDQERERQDAKFGTLHFRQYTDWKKYTVLGEEVGEVAHAILERDENNLAEELVQVAAVCVAWLEDYWTRV